MKTTQWVIIAFLFVLVIGLFIYNSGVATQNYPGSELILKKYYPENEFLGMANDQSWHQVSISDAAIEDIKSWYDHEFSTYTQVENSSDYRCSKKTWQEGEKIKLRVTICNHGDYRTIMSITPGFW